MAAWFLENTLVAGAVALLVAGAIRFLSLRPAVAHLLWIATLGVLLMPRLPWVATPGSLLRQGLRDWLGAPAAANAEANVAAEPVPSDIDPLSIGVAQLAPASHAPATPSPAPLARSSTWTLDLQTLERAAWLLWLGGAAFVLLRSARRIVPFHRLVKRSPAAPRALRLEVSEVARRLGVRAPEVRSFAGVASPSIWCLGRPRLLWPAESRKSDSRSARAALIAHELAHLARKDHWVSWLEIPAAALAWWNPLFWWIRGRIRHFAELSCDAWAVWAYPADRRAFAEALLDMQARTRTAPVTLQGLGATDSEFKDFERRLDMIMRKGMFPGVSKGAAVFAALAAVLTSPGFSAGEGDGKCTASASCSSAVVESRARGVKLAEKAGELLGAKQYEAALAALQEVVALDPQNGWAHGQLGFAQIGLKDFAAAQQSFQRQFELGADRTNALYNRSCVLALAGDSEAAVASLAAAVQHGFADVALMAKDADLASIRSDARFAKVSEMARSATELRKDLARFEQEGKQDLFLAAHAELAAILIADGKLQSEHGHLALKAGDREGAALAFGRQAESGFDVTNALYNRACARSLAGDTQGALGDLQFAAEKGMGYAGIAKDTDLDPLRNLPGFAELEATILATAESTLATKKLLSSSDVADAPALAALAADTLTSEKVRGLAAQALGKLELAQGRFAEAYAAFEQGATLGDVRGSAFGMAQALAGAGKKDAALRHAEIALDLGFADPDAVRALLATNELASPADAELLVARAEKAKAKGMKEYGEKGKAWAAGMKSAPAAYGKKVAQQ